MNQTWFSLIPFIIVISLSIWQKRILPGLVLGLIVGAFLLEFQVLGGSKQTVHYIAETLSNRNNINIIGFLYLFGGLIGMMTIAGGIKGFSKWAESKIDSQRGLLRLIWLTLPFTFMMPMFRTMMVGPVIKSLVNKMNMSKWKVGFTLDISTSSIIVLLPVATAFVGFMISLVENGVQKFNLNMDPYNIFLLSILFNFYAIIMLIIGLIQTFRSSPDNNTETQVTEDHNYHRSGIKEEMQTVKAQPWNLIVPLALLLGLTLFLLWEDGMQKGATTFIQAFSQADATFVMLLAVFITLVLTFIFYMIRKQPIEEIIFHFFDGGNQLMQAIVLLVLVWALSLVAEDLGFSAFINSTLGDFLPGFTVPAIVFLLGAVISYFIGSSFGTWGLLMPIGISLAVSAGASLPLTVGAVFASGSFGAMTSPLGDTTITTASILDMPMVKYARYKLKLCAVGAGIALVGYLAMGFFLS